MFSSCQVPCGIFDDPARIKGLVEDAKTIRKATDQTSELAKAGATSAQSLNQATRWINTKEDHADKIISTVSEYMLAQRVKPAVFSSDHEYRDALVTHHTVMLAAVRIQDHCHSALLRSIHCRVSC